MFSPENDHFLIEKIVEAFSAFLTLTVFRAPYSIDCLAPYGGPVIPGLALGGASKEKNYLDAVGVSLTFITSNSIDKNEIQDSLAWESK